MTGIKPTLLVLAAGMGSRYGGNKQLDSIGPNGETIIDYSIFDAARAGFGKIVFVIRRDIEEQFIEQFVKPLKGFIELDYVFQDLDDLPEGLVPPVERVKPWGTSHAILVANKKIKEPFGVINSDDFYGFEAFKTLHDFLVNDSVDTNYTIIGYKMGNTLSDHGDVNRGVCKVDALGKLVDIVETRQIEKKPEGIFAPDGKGGFSSYSSDDIVSMNLWGFKPGCFKYLEEEFINFIKRNSSELKAELDIPTSMDVFVKRGDITIEVLMTDERWFGVTYKEDKPFVVNSINKMISEGVYPEKLW